MKPFDLEEALAGKPVRLRNGNKAYIMADYIEFFPLNIFRLQGVCLVGDSKTQYERNQWTEDGFSFFKNDKYSINNNPYDIIGMYEEPTPTVTVTLPIPFKPKIGEPFFYINKSIIGNLIVDSSRYTSDEREIENCAPTGNCFRTEEDAQAWLNAMKGALNE